LGVEAIERAEGSSLSEDETQRLRQVLVARYGVEIGSEAWHDAVAYAWQHRERLRGMENPIGFLYRVAQSSVRRHHRWARPVHLPPIDVDRVPDIEPGLVPALTALSQRQRTVVLLVHAHGWTQQEAADVLGMSVSTLRNHLRRAMEHLRRTLGVDDA
jgi:RNA polymerase sigma factor (sigma-70 family)